MTGYQFYSADHPFVLRWTTEAGTKVVQHGRLHQITQSSLAVMLHRPLEDDEIPRSGGRVFAETREYRGLHLKRIRGAVTYSSSRLVEIQLQEEPTKVQRRRYLRSGVAHCFATAILLSEDARRYLLVRPVDIGQGGIRFSHRLPLQAGDRMQVTLRLEQRRTITPTAEIIETWPQTAQAASLLPVPPTQISRARFVHLGHDEQAAIAQYVMRTLRSLQ
jgi:hypothetical protein